MSDESTGNIEPREGGEPTSPFAAPGGPSAASADATGTAAAGATDTARSTGSAGDTPTQSFGTPTRSFEAPANPYATPSPRAAAGDSAAPGTFTGAAAPTGYGAQSTAPRGTYGAPRPAQGEQSGGFASPSVSYSAPAGTSAPSAGTGASAVGASAAAGAASAGAGAPTQRLGDPYTSTPQAPAGYSFSREGSTWGSPAGAPSGARPAQAAAAAPASPSTTYTKQRRRGPGWGGVIAVSLATALLASGGTAALINNGSTGTTGTASSVSTPAAVATGSTTKTVAATGSSPDWEAVTSAVSNAVVSITVATSSGTAEGSGVVYDSSGHIITNNHVVSGASQIQVTLADGRIYEAELTGTDSATDLAVIQFKNAPSDLTVAQFGDSSNLVTGQDVMAIGNPLGLSSTATTGIISALDRPVVTTEESTGDSGSSGMFGQSQTTSSQVYTNAIQIDAAINPGNSGGPLFDETGKVIGITSSIASMSSRSSQSGSIGIGFAIPSNLVVKVADQIIKTGTATHAYLGVSIGDGSGTVDGTTRAGAEVGSVESGSPAGDAGLQQGDVITAINGKTTSQAAALTGFVRQYSSGDQVTLTVIRDGKEIQLTATLSERKDS